MIREDIISALTLWRKSAWLPTTQHGKVFAIHELTYKFVACLFVYLFVFTNKYDVKNETRLRQHVWQLVNVYSVEVMYVRKVWREGGGTFYDN